MSHDLIGDQKTVGRIELHVINAMIDAAKNLNDAMLPTYAAPKIWRMTNVWLYEIAPETKGHMSKVLPDNFVTHVEVMVREEEARRIEEDAEAAADNER